MMMLAYRPWQPVEQARDKILSSKRPASTNPFRAWIVRFYPAVLHSPRKFQPGPPALLPQAVLSQQAVAPQPRLSFLSASQIAWITAPAILLQSLPLPQQPGAHRIQMHIITHRAQITRRRSIDQERLVTPGKRWPLSLCRRLKRMV